MTTNIDTNCANAAARSSEVAEDLIVKTIVSLIKNELSQLLEKSF